MLTAPVWRGMDERRRAVRALAVGLLLGGVTTATLLWLLGGLGDWYPAPLRIPSVIALALVALARDAGLIRFELPQNAHQIPQSVFDDGAARGAFRFGFELGLGWRTYVTSTLPYVLALSLILLDASLLAVIVTGAGFGIGRSFAAWARLIAPSGDLWDMTLARVSRVLPPLACAAALVSLVALVR